VGKADISKIENGNRNLTIGTLDRIAKALECRIDVILKRGEGTK
jgi:transcriptional regulator with XRE-family HTH domain